MKRIYSGVEVTYQNETDYNQSNVVYLITFPNGKKYIGSTTKVLTRRMSRHCSESRNLCSVMDVSVPIREHGKCMVRVLDTESTIDRLIKLEDFYIVEYRANEIEFGYNNRVKGCYSDKSRNKMSVSRKRRKTLSETKIKTSVTMGEPFSDDFGNVFRSISHAAEYYNCNKSHIWYTINITGFSKKLCTGFHYLKTTE